MTDKTLDRIADALEKLVDAYAQAQRRDHCALTDRPETEWNFNEVRWLTDRYAANEARQREEAAQPDPLDEDDHSTRLLADGTPLTRSFRGHWHTPQADCQGICGSKPDPRPVFTLALWDEDHGPLTFAPDASPAPQDAAQGAAEGEGDAVEGGEAAGAKLNVQIKLLCQECGHGIESHTDDGCLACDSTGVCLCQRTPSAIARHLIAQASS